MTHPRSGSQRTRYGAVIKRVGLGIISHNNNTDHWTKRELCAISIVFPSSELDGICQDLRTEGINDT